MLPLLSPTINEEIYFSALSEFYDLYQQALEADTISMRHTLMAMAEAMFLESGVGIPIYTAGGSYKMVQAGLPHRRLRILDGRHGEL